MGRQENDGKRMGSILICFDRIRIVLMDKNPGSGSSALLFSLPFSQAGSLPAGMTARKIHKGIMLFSDLKREFTKYS